MFISLLLFATNPFAFDSAPRDLEDTQKSLRKIEIATAVDDVFLSFDPPYIVWEQLYFRCSRGIKQTILNGDTDPITCLQKIGDGGSRCIVCHVTFDKDYPELLSFIPSALEQVGFNGYFYYRVGGFPNPTGKELKYAAVPYSFKIFAMLEAQKLGFTSVLWMDSCLLPLEDPSPLFDILEEKGALLTEQSIGFNDYFLPPKTAQILENLTQVNLFKSTVVRGGLFGLRMDDPLAESLIQQYYEMVELGTPFLSYLPEEFVLSAILGQPEFASWKGTILHDWFTHTNRQVITALENEQALFLYRGHL